MKSTILLLASVLVLSLTGCSSLSMTRPDGTGIRTSSLFTKATLESGSAKLGAAGQADEIKFAGLQTDQMAVANAFMTALSALAEQLLALKAELAQARVEAATANAQLSSLLSRGAGPVPFRPVMPNQTPQPGR